MPLPARIACAIMDTVLGRLTLLFMTGAVGDLAIARQAAAQMLAAYNIETEEELRLAAEIISLGFHVLEALSQAADPDLSLNQVIRLRGSAVSLSRESHKFQRKLDQLQRDRRAGVPAQSAEAQAEIPSQPSDTSPSRPQIDKAIGLIEFAREAIESATKNGGMTWTQSLHQRQTAKRIADKLIRKEAEHARRSAQSNPPKPNARALDAPTLNPPTPNPPTLNAPVLDARVAFAAMAAEHAAQAVPVV
jgi:hypothetical protein